MTYLLIAFVIVVALAPLSHFMPSKQQRRTAKLRESAALAGLFVEFRSLPGAEGAGRDRVGGQVIYYGLRLRPSRGKQQRVGAWRSWEDGWRSVGVRLPVPPQLAAMPAEIEAASVDEASCGVYWREAGDEQTVTEIRRLLGDWSELLQS